MTRDGRRSNRRYVHGKAFDPYPYIALNLVLSGLAGIQAPIIMMSQNRAAARDELLARHHYDETQSIPIKAPRFWAVLAFPLTGSGKIRKLRLRGELAGQLRPVPRNNTGNTGCG